MNVELKLAILKTGKSQRQIAAETGIPESRLSLLVRGWAQPRPNELEELARVLGRLPQALIDGWSTEVAHVNGR